MECVECGVTADDHAEGWRGYRTDEPDTNDSPEVAFYCPSCAEREFGPLWIAAPAADELS
jgi:hypothetical protein